MIIAWKHVSVCVWTLLYCQRTSVIVNTSFNMWLLHLKLWAGARCTGWERTGGKYIKQYLSLYKLKLSGIITDMVVCVHNRRISIVKWTICEHTVLWEECCSAVIKHCVDGEHTNPPSSAILRLSLNTGFKMYPCRPPCSCWLCQRRSPASTETHSSWSLQVEDKDKKKQKQIKWIGYHCETWSPPFSL